jgi:hypothetical protein
MSDPLQSLLIKHPAGLLAAEPQLAAVQSAAIANGVPSIHPAMRPGAKIPLTIISSSLRDDEYAGRPHGVNEAAEPPRQAMAIATRNLD